jgi:hypothetical protein
MKTSELLGKMLDVSKRVTDSTAAASSATIASSTRFAKQATAMTVEMAKGATTMTIDAARVTGNATLDVSRKVIHAAATTATATATVVGDLNGDGKVDVEDLKIAAKATRDAMIEGAKETGKFAKEVMKTDLIKQSAAGAIAGGAIGSAIPLVGTVTGAAVGAAIGLAKSITK